MVEGSQITRAMTIQAGSAKRNRGQGNKMKGNSLFIAPMRLSLEARRWIYLGFFFWFVAILMMLHPFPFVARADSTVPVKMYTVKSGDSIWSIADKLSNGKNIIGTIETIESDNKLPAYAVIQVGQILLIPNQM